MQRGLVQLVQKEHGIGNLVQTQVLEQLAVMRVRPMLIGSDELRVGESTVIRQLDEGQPHAGSQRLGKVCFAQARYAQHQDGGWGHGLATSGRCLCTGSVNLDDFSEMGVLIQQHIKHLKLFLARRDNPMPPAAQFLEPPLNFLQSGLVRLGCALNALGEPLDFCFLDDRHGQSSSLRIVALQRHWHVAGGTVLHLGHLMVSLYGGVVVRLCKKVLWMFFSDQGFGLIRCIVVRFLRLLQCGLFGHFSGLSGLIFCLELLQQ